MKIEEAVKRLAFIKYLYDVGIEQSKRPEPGCWASILTFHDSIELFLALTAEYLDLGQRIKNIEFMKYWSLLNPILREKGKSELTQQISIERLNKARVDFKHYSNPPSKSAIENFRASINNFFEENTLIVFDKDFSDISLIELVGCQATKDSLKEAQENLKKDMIEDSLDNVALAFVQLLDDYESRKRDEYGQSPFFLGEVGESVPTLQETVRILSFGLDYRRYVKFHLLTPAVLKILGGSPIIQRIRRGSKGVPTKEDVKFCIDFVIESAITLQEFDFSIENERRDKPFDTW